jgi:hypothetical protein
VRRPGRHAAAAQFAAHQVGVVGEAIGRLAVQPAALVLQVLGQIPVIERDEGLDAALAQAIDQALVEVDALGVGLASQVHHARPGNGKAVGIHAQTLQDVQVFVEAVVVVAGHVAVLAAQHLARRGAEAVPDRFEPAVFMCGALDLVRRGAGAEDEVAAAHR